MEWTNSFAPKEMPHLLRFVSSFAAALIFLCSAPVFAGEVGRYFDRFVTPLRAEAGPVLSPPMGALPRTEVWAGFGLKHHDWEVGRAKYSQLATRLVIGGEWRPEKLPRLGVGGSLVALQTTSIHTKLPPAIDERDRYADLGILRLHVRVRTLTLERALKPKLPIALALTPFFRMGLPTDTARLRQDRRMSIRHVLDSDVAQSPYFLVEPGVAAGFLFWRINLYTHHALMLAPIKSGETYWFYSLHNGIAAKIMDMFELVFELNGLMRLTKDSQDNRRSAWAASPGLRFIHGALSYELSARFGYGKDPAHPYGNYTIACAISWHPGG